MLQSMKQLTSARALERMSFMWSEARLLIAALALFLGGVPPIIEFAGWLPGVGLGLTLAWVISGLASLYLAYRWFSAGEKIFGTGNSRDLLAFTVLVVSGINLGLAGVLGRNIGMSISSSYIVFIVVGLLYLWSAYYLWKRWKKHNERLF